MFALDVAYPGKKIVGDPHQPDEVTASRTLGLSNTEPQIPRAVGIAVHPELAVLLYRVCGGSCEDAHRGADHAVTGLTAVAVDLHSFERGVSAVQDDGYLDHPLPITSRKYRLL